LKAVIYIGHGTRVKEGNEQFKQFIEKVKEKVMVPIQEVAFLERAKPTIQEAIDQCVQQGATTIAVVPVLLLAAGHAKSDIPEAIKQAQITFPTVTFSYGRPVGADITVIDMLIDRLREQGFSHDDITNREQATVLLVGRGSSDPQANSDLVKIARLLWELCPVDAVETCYLAATTPNFQDGLEHVLQMENKKVYVIPYLLFTGILMNRMREEIAAANQQSEKEFVLSDYLGYHPKLVDIIVNRVFEALTDKLFMSCDSCTYRLQAPNKGG
jgi:sirohydrochlorin ferrochelatase